jgi:hypothetical protein
MNFQVGEAAADLVLESTESSDERFPVENSTEPIADPAPPSKEVEDIYIFMYLCMRIQKHE